MTEQIDASKIGFSTFPDPLAPPRIKEDKIKWGLPLAKAIWTAFNNTNYKTLFGSTAVYEEYLQYAFGEQNKYQYKPRTDGDPNDLFHQFVPKSNDDIVNYATKRLRIVVEKLASMQYDPIADVTDSAAIDRKKDYQARLKLSMEQRQLFEMLSAMTGANQFPEGVEPDQIPFDKDDLAIELEMNYKDRISMEIEEGVSYHLKYNDFEAKKEHYAFDLGLIGAAGLYVGMNENGKPEIKYIRPDFAIVPDNDDDVYHGNLPWAGHIEMMTVADWRKHHNGEFSRGEEEIIISQHSVKGNNIMGQATNNYMNRLDAEIMPVMCFEHKTVNEQVNLEYIDPNGNERFIEKDYDYYRTAGSEAQFKAKYGDTRKLHRKPYSAIYKGYWIIGSEYIYRYGQKEYTVYDKQGGKIGEPMIGYVFATPSMKSGRTAGLMKQMKPVLDDLQRDNLKIRELLSNPFPAGVQIDIFALRKTSFKLNGKVLDTEDIVKLAFKNKIFLIDSSDGNYAAGSNYRAIEEMNLGVTLADHIQLLQHHLIKLDEIIGYNQVSSASPSLPERTPVRIAQIQQQTTDNALGFLFKADFQMFKQCCKILAGLHLQALKNNPEYYANIFGTDSIDFVNDPEFDFDSVEYGIEIEPRPTSAEWEEFYLKLEKLEANGKLEASDIISIKRFTNLKKAGAYMRVLEKRRAREAQQNAMALEQQKQEAEMNKLKLQSSLIVEEEKAKQATQRVKTEGEIMVENVKHQNMMREIKVRESLTGFTKDYIADKSNQTKITSELIKAKTKQKATSKD